MTIKLKILLFLTVGALLTSCSEKQVKLQVESGPLTESVYASVEIYPEDLFYVYPSKSGIIEAIFVEEGDTVYMGQELAVIMAENSKISSDNALIGLKLAEKKLKGKDATLAALRNEINTKKKQVSLDSTNYFRQKSLFEKKIGAKAEVDQREMQYELSKSQLEVLKINFKQTKLDLESAYQTNSNTFKSAKNNLDEFTIKSLMDGRIYDLQRKPGEFISSQQPLASIGNKKTFIAQLMIDEVDIAKVRIGQKTIISLDAFEGKNFEVYITKIRPTKQERTQSFIVEAKFINPPEVLYPGMSGEANIIIQEKEKVLSIPLEYLFDNNKVLTENGEIEVKLGFRNLSRVQILSGLEEGDFILKPEND